MGVCFLAEALSGLVIAGTAGNGGIGGGGGGARCDGSRFAGVWWPRWLVLE